MSAYLNEFDPFAAACSRNLGAAGHIIHGEVDERSILDVRPDELAGFRQCHFFHGIGVWPLALRIAGWPDDRPVWTGSCPCQPFSAAGKGKGFADERHLWPLWFHLIEQRRPQCILGEQVASPDGLAWLDLVSADLEAAGYTVGAVDTCAAGFGAPHIRQRLYWVAYANDAGSQGRRVGGHGAGECASRPGGMDGGLAVPNGGGREPGRIAAETSRHGDTAFPDGGSGRLADANGRERDRIANGEGCLGDGAAGGRLESDGEPERRGAACRPGPTNGFWRDADWLHCRDEKWRAVEPGTFPLADAGAFRNRVALLRGSGNALNVAQAAAFVESVMGALDSLAEAA